jgi:SNF2 family DNA or RNA helicase
MLALGCDKAENHLCSQIPGMNFRQSDGIWRCPLSWPAYVAFRTVWSQQWFIESPDLQAWAERAWSGVQIAYGLRSATDAPPDIAKLLDEIESTVPARQAGDGTISLDPKHLYPFQRGGAAWLALQRRAALTDPQGNGKTPQLIRALQVAQDRGGDALPALVVCPGAALFGWRDELAAWAPELAARVVTGTALKRHRQLAEEGEADVYLIAWPTLRYHTRLAAYPSQAFVRCDEHGGNTQKTAAQCEVHLKELNELPVRTVIADEAHRMASPKTKQARAVWWLAGQAGYFWPVTGTPVADTIADFWPIGHGIDPKAFPAKSRYLDLYAVKNLNWHGGTEILGIRPETEAAYHATVQPYMRRIPKEIARPDMPPRLPPVFRYPPLTPAQARIYKELKKELLADLPDGHMIVPGNSLVVFSRLCQVASSSIANRDGEDGDGFTRQEIERCLPSNKADDLIDFLGDNPGPLVVAAWSPELIALCGHKLDLAKITHARVTGGMPPEAQHQAVTWFQDGTVRVIFITAAGAESITLTAADTIYFIEPEPSLLKREQKIGRIDRIGQRNPVRVVYAISPGTTDQRLYELGCEKQERADAVTRDADLIRWIIGETAAELETADAG